jgi:hypothetical protein
MQLSKNLWRVVYNAEHNQSRTAVFGVVGCKKTTGNRLKFDRAGVRWIASESEYRLWAIQTFPDIRTDCYAYLLKRSGCPKNVTLIQMRHPFRVFFDHAADLIANPGQLRSILSLELFYLRMNWSRKKSPDNRQWMIIVDKSLLSSSKRFCGTRTQVQ